MNSLQKEEFTVSISGEIAQAVQKHYCRDDYSLIVENFFKLLLPKKREVTDIALSSRLRGCAAASGLVHKTDREIKRMMYSEKYGI